VVAGEVKHLASQTAKATEDIGTQIGAVQEATEGAVKAIASIVRRIEEINTISAAIAAAVEEQSAATAEIAR
ncbi:MAG TPA: methyl-accepting chemotaxis protein, partial [Rhodospirillum rubrum]|nr:methyl-accepting chemotaxis protein [Rhodospirillum rubrum]